MNENALAKIADFIKDLLTPKKNIGDSTSYMNGGRGADLVNGKSTPSGWYEAFMLEKYVKDTTPVGDPRRVQFSAENNLKRIINWTPLILIIGVVILVYVFGMPTYYRWRHHYDELQNKPRVESEVIGRVSTPQMIRMDKDIFDEPIAHVFSKIPKGYDMNSLEGNTYRVFEGEWLISERKKHPKKNRLIIKWVPGGIDILDPDDPNNIERHLWMYENQKFYIYNEELQVWNRAYKVPELERIGFNPEYAIIAKGTNIIIRFE